VEREKCKRQRLRLALVHSLNEDIRAAAEPILDS
jgi:hypothetical protein